jgi:two-component system cell cycle sensor histidine kinase/response regulator CckA
LAGQSSFDMPESPKDAFSYEKILLNLSEGLWRIDFLPPLDATVSFQEFFNRYERISTFSMCNDALAKMYGYDKAADLLNLKFLNFVIDTDQHRAGLRSFHQSGFSLAGLETKEQDRYGNIKYFINSYYGEIRDGKLYRMWGTQVDVTGSRIAQIQLLEALDGFNFMFDKMPIGCIVWSIDRDVLNWNDSAEKIFGWQPIEAIGQLKIENVLPQNAREHVNKIWQELVMDGIANHSINENLTKDGRIIMCEWFNTPLRRSGRLYGVLSIVQDVSEKQRLEQQLLHAQKMESIGTLAGGIAHDFNNILTGILGHLSLLKIRMQPEMQVQTAKTLDLIETLAFRAAELTQQLLGFARGGKYNVTSTDLNDVVQHVIRIVSQTFDRSIHIETKLQKPLGFVEADQGQLEQTLLNLFINAKDAMPDGGTLSVSTSVVSADNLPPKLALLSNTWVVLCVRDTGIGMTPEVQKRIFEPFFSTKEKSHGTGMGLAMTYGIVKNHGGHIDVSSEVGRGTTFTIYLPLSQDAVQPEVIDAAEVVAYAGSLAGLHVLVVDDEQDILTVTQEFLRNEGCIVTAVCDTDQALTVFREYQNKIDVVILDMIMPKVSGRKLFVEMRTLLPAVPIILMSGYSVNDTVQNLLEQVHAAFMKKPFSFSELRSALRELLNR